MLDKLRVSVFILAFLITGKIYGFTINIDTNGYAGYYSVNGGAFVLGNNSFDLPAGTYSFSHLPGSFNFSVDSSGNVTSLQPGSATGSGSTLTLITTVVQIDPQLFQRYYSAYNHSPAIGVQNLTLITNSQHRLITSVGGMITNFEVDGAGNITALSDPDNVIVSNAKITLKNATLTIDPGKYTGDYQVNEVNYKGIQKVILISGAQHRITIAYGGTIADFTAKYDGTVTNIGRTNLVLGNGRVTFKTVPLKIYPGHYSAGYFLLGYESVPKFNESTFEIIPEASNRVSQRTGVTIGDFVIDDQGDISWTSSNSIKYEKNALYFKNQRVNVQPPSGFSGNWYIFYVSTYQFSDTNLFLVPYTEFTLYVNDATIHTFQITDCSGNTNVSTPAGTFVISCITTDRVKLVDLNPSDFVDLKQTFQAQYLNRKYSTNINDFAFSNNGTSLTLTADNFTDHLFTIEGSLVNGRNAIQFSGKDEITSTFMRGYTIWAGHNIVEVDTGSPTLNYDVTVNVIQNISGTDYFFGVTKTTQNGKATFVNVPNAYVWISTTRNYVEQIGRYIDRDTKIQL